MSVPAGSSVYAITFSGRVNANFIPLPGYHEVVQRRQGDDTAGVLAPDSRDLPAGLQAVGYSAPNPGNYWEMTIAVFTRRHVRHSGGRRRRSVSTSPLLSRSKSR